MHIRRDLYLLQELTRMVVEAQKYHHLPSPGWTTRKAGGVIHPESEGLRIRAQECKSWSKSDRSQTRSASVQRQRRQVSQLSRESKFTLSQPFCSVQVPSWIVTPVGTVLTQSAHSNANVFPRHGFPRQKHTQRGFTSHLGIPQLS